MSRKEFVRMVIEVYEVREQILESIESEEGIRNVFRRLVYFFVTFIALLIFLGIAGVSVNTLIISGAASLSSLTVALSASINYSNLTQRMLNLHFFDTE